MGNRKTHKRAKLAARLSAGELYRVPYCKAKRSLRSHSFGHTLTHRRGVVKANANKIKTVAHNYLSIWNYADYIIQTEN